MGSLSLDDQHWVDTWTTALHAQNASQSIPLSHPSRKDQMVFVDTTIRQTVRVSLGAHRQIRIRISNEYTDSALSLSGVTLALPAPKKDGKLPGSPLIDSSSVTQVKFSGYTEVDIPAGGNLVSDPINFALKDAQDITISMHLPRGQHGPWVTAHENTKTISWLAHGDQTSSAELVNVRPVEHWYYISAVEGLVSSDVRAVACFGDSITDRGADIYPYNQYTGWTDVLDSRLRSNPNTRNISAVNLGISGDRIWDGGLKRFDRDVTSHAGVKYIMLLMGINDLGNSLNTTLGQEVIYERLVIAFTQFIQKAHTHDIPIFGSTIMPFLSPPGHTNHSPYVDAEREKTRVKLNEWIKNQAGFDYVIDWSSIVSDPKRPNMMKPEYQFGDYVHPSPEGNRIMGNAIDLGIFEQFKDGWTKGAKATK